MSRVGIIGAGSWGTALSLVLANNGHSVEIWSIVENEIEMLKEKHEHIDKLPGVKLPDSITFTTDIEAKGIEENTLMTISDVVESEIPCADVAVMCGPSHAEEVGQLLPTTVVAGARTQKTAEIVQDLFMNEVFRVYTSPDVLGMELGGSLKNVIALAAGMADGLGYGDNTKAALITRGIAEISVLAIEMGAKAETLFGLTGIGDLIGT